MENSKTAHFSSALQVEEAKFKGQEAIEPAKPPEIPPRRLPLPKAPHNPIQQPQTTEKSQKDAKSDQNTRMTSIESNVGPTALLLKDLRGGPQSAPYEQPMEPVRVFLHDLKVRPLPATSFKAIFVCANSDNKIFAMCALSESEYIRTIEAAVEKVAKRKTGLYLPKVNEVILAKFEGTFYRAVCKSRSSRGIEVLYIDYGNFARVREQEICKLDDELRFDVVVHNVFVENFPDQMSSEVATILNKAGVPIESAFKVKNEDKFSYTVRIAGL